MLGDCQVVWHYIKMLSLPTPHRTAPAHESNGCGQVDSSWLSVCRVHSPVLLDGRFVLDKDGKQSASRCCIDKGVGWLDSSKQEECQKKVQFSNCSWEEGESRRHRRGGQIGERRSGMGEVRYIYGMRGKEISHFYF